MVMNKKLEKLTGAVSVDGDVTPTLREKIEQVDPHGWGKMSVSELWEQKTTLMNRVVMAQQAGHPELVPQIQRGINTIDAILTARQAEQESKLI